MGARIQSWFQIQICINGREWLARQMDKAGVSYLRKEDCFVRIEDLRDAQRLMEEQLKSPWPKLLGDVARSLNSIHEEIFAKYPLKYYWSVHQSEWAADVMFKRQISEKAPGGLSLKDLFGSKTKADEYPQGIGAD